MSAVLFSTLGRLPIPIFGNARLAVNMLFTKAKHLPKYAPWALPGLIGGVWFVWPAVTDGAKIMIGLLPDPEVVAAAAEEAAAVAEKAAASMSKEELQAAAALSLIPIPLTPAQKKLAAAEASGDFSHLYAVWEKRDVQTLSFEDEEEEDEDDDDDDEEEGDEEESDDDDDDDDDE